MHKFFLFILLCFFYSNQVISQRVYFANPFSIKDFSYHIIGRVKDNILVWQHFNSNKISNIIVYNNKMELIKIVPLNFNNKLITQRFNFINYRGFFDIITQYYDKKYFYSLSARFNDQAEMITKIDTIEVQKISQAQGFEIRNCITSSDKKHTFLYRMVTHKNIDSIVIDCISLNNELKTKIKKVLVILHWRKYLLVPVYNLIS